MLQEILKNDFVEYSEVYRMAAELGMSRSEVKLEKRRLGVQTVTLTNGDERLWLWYIPKNVWNKYLPKG